MTAVKAIRLSGVTKRFGPTTALRGVSAEFEQSSINVVIGANGSGKSTLLGIVSLTLKPTAGEVAFDPLEDEREIRGEIGLLSHDSLAYGDLSGRRNIELAGELHGMTAAESWERARATFELGAFAERPVRTNSRGQRQRVALARALVHEPSVVLLDEPTTGLDPTGIERLLHIVEQTLARPTVMVVVTHEPDVFRKFAPRVWEMARGQLTRFT